MSKKNSYDFLVIGSNLSSFLIADKLSERGKKVALVPAKESMEDFRLNSNSTPCTSHEPYKSVAFSQEKEMLINWLEDEFFRIQGLEYHIEDTHAVTFDGGSFKPFLGFGDRKLKTIEELSEYLAPRQIFLDTRIQYWIDERIKTSRFEFLEKTDVTDITVTEGMISEVTLNGKKTVFAEEIIYAGDPMELIELIHDDHLGTREKQRIAKTSMWTRLNIKFQFSEDADFQPHMHVLMGTKDEFEPVIGEFYLDDEGVVCHWTYLLDSEVAESAESVAGVIKYIKRQIKRAYPELLTSEHKEKITLHTNTHGNVKDWNKLRLKGIKNLVLASPQFSNLKGPVAHLDMAQKTLNDLLSNEVVEEPNSDETEQQDNA